MAELLAAYGRAGRSPLDLLRLEQEEWQPYTGGMTRFSMALGLAGMIYPGSDYAPYYDCGIEEGRYNTRIFAYPLVDGLNYFIRATHGELGERREEIVAMNDAHRVALKTEIELKYPAQEMISYAWDGECHDSNLDVVPPPVLQLSADRRRVVWSPAVYGAIKVKYTVHRHVYGLSVLRRDEAVENRYSSVVYGVYDGGRPVHLVVAPPPGAEELDGACGQGGGGITIEPPGPPPESLPDPNADRTTVRNWCDPHEVISDSVAGV